MTARPPIVLIAARNEADRLPATLRALAAAFPGARIVVGDDASTDATARLAREAGAEVVRAPDALGKGGAATLAARAVLDVTTRPDPPPVLLCDADLADSAARLAPLLHAVESGAADVAVAIFARRVGGGFGLAVGTARRLIARATGQELEAPLSGQRALRGEVLACVVPFAAGFGMEVGMTIDAHRAGFAVAEVEVDLTHRATGRTLGGFAHRARQLRDLVRAGARRA